MDAVFTIYLLLISLFNGVAVTNFFTAPKLKISKIKHAEKYPLVSVVVPMRNEENNAENIINDLLNQNYPNLEIILVDDDSTDGTWNIINKYKDFKKIKVLKLSEHNINWIGKSWAIHNGLSHAKGNIYALIDSDVRLHYSAILSGFGVLLSGDCDAVTCFPSQIRNSIGEELIVPLMTWSHVGHIPMALVNKSSSSALAMANGQFIMCTKTAYIKTGGHNVIKSEINEDIALIRKFKDNGFKVNVVLGDKLIKCRMYTGFISAQKGFGRSLTHAFNNILNLLLVVLFWTILFLLPYLLAFFDQKYIIIVLGIILHRLITSLNLGENPILNIVLHPIQLITLIEISLYSLYLTVMHKIEWKGRKINKIVKEVP